MKLIDWMQFFRTTSVVAVGAALLVLGHPILAFTAEPYRKPNVIIILADDLGYGDVGCFQSLHPGIRDAKTPAIDSLARNGMMLSEFYAQPVCTPARYCLLTGQYLARSKDLRDLIVLDYDYPVSGLRQHETTMAEVFKDAGYQTGIVGKWHLGSGEMVVRKPPKPPFSEKNEFHPNAHGFDYFYGFLGGSIDYCTHEKKAAFFDWYENRQLLYDRDSQGRNAHPDHGRYATHLITEKSLELIDQYAEGNNPFFLYVAYPAPHWAQTAQQDSLHVHQLPNEESDPRSDRYRYYLKRFDDTYPGNDSTNWRKRLLAMVCAMDDGVGQILRRLRELKLEDDTILLFTSDNGGETRYGMEEEIAYGSSNGPFMRGDKATLYEGGIRVPAIIQFKRQIPAGSVSRQIASIVDVKVTLGRMAGVDTDQYGDDGINLSPNFRCPGRIIERDFFYYSGHFGDIYRSDKWKYLRRKTGQHAGIDELYDLEADPAERNNLAMQRADITNQLKQKHAATLQTVLDDHDSAASFENR